MRRSRRVRCLAGVGALALLATACGGDGGEGGTQTTGGTYSIFITEPQYLTPPNSNEVSGSEVLDALFTPLVNYKIGTNEIVLSELTESIETTDSKTWTIKIKPGWTFHNGEPVTAQSFVDTWNYAALSTNGQNNAPFFSSISGYQDVHPDDPNPADKVTPKPTARTMSGLKVVSPTEFTVALSVPNNTFKTALGYTAFYPMPPAAFKDIKAYQEAPIGNGPFRMKGTWQHNRKISVEAYPDYKGTKPKADGIEFKVYQALETAYNDLRTGNLDVMDALPPSALAGAKAELGDRYQTFPSSYFMFLGFPTFDPKYADIKVRQAISMAIDRPAISKTIFRHTRVPADAFVSPVVDGYRAGFCGELCTYNPARAKQLLAQSAGLTEMTFTYNADGGHKEWVEAACYQIQNALGVKCRPVAKPTFDVLLDDLDKSKTSRQGFGPFRLGWIMDYPSMLNYLDPIYRTGGSSNYYGYSNPQFDKMIAEGATKPSEDEAIRIWQQAEEIVKNDFPIAPLFFGVTNAANSPRVRNLKVDALDHIDKVNVEVVKRS